MTSSASPRGLVFGSAAESYERFRLGYPDEVVDRTLAYAGRHLDGRVARAVEIGAGTGKATRAFASRGIQVTALEPDPHMFAVLSREAVAMPVTPVQCSLEAYAGDPVPLVYAAASMHWTDPVTRWARIADLLVDGGTVAVFGASMDLADDHVRSAFEAARNPLLPDDDYHHKPLDGIEDDGRFADVTEEVVPRVVVVPQKEFVGYLSTVSAYLLMSLEERQHVLHRIAAALPEQVAVDVTVRLHLARLASR
jgi:SAM-dependent methyltransferase